MVRAAVSSVFLIAILNTSFSDLGHLPATILRPMGIMQLLSWRFYDSASYSAGHDNPEMDNGAIPVAERSRRLNTVDDKNLGLLVLFYQGLLRSFGHFNHDEMLGVYYLTILAFSPCGDGFSIDSLPGQRAKKAGVCVRVSHPVDVATDGLGLL